MIEQALKRHRKELVRIRLRHRGGTEAQLGRPTTASQGACGEQCVLNQTLHHEKKCARSITTGRQAA